MTGMPAAVAALPTPVSWSPSCGKMISASGFSAIAVCTAAICDGASGAASSALKSTSGYVAACCFAKELMAARKPWSATGPENRIFTFLPGAEPASLLAGLAALLSLAVGSAELDVQLERRTPVVTAATVIRSRRGLPPDFFASRTVTASPGVWWDERGGRSCGAGSAQGADAELLDEDGRDDDHALGDQLVLDREVVDDEQVRDLGEDENAQHRADDRAAATRQRGAADDDGGDGL